MPQFDLHENRNPKTKGLIPYLLDIQSDLLADLATSVVIPVCLAGTATRGMTRLTPEVEIDGQSYLLLTPQLASIPRKGLGKTVANLSNNRNEIIGAVDFLLAGF